MCFFVVLYSRVRVASLEVEKNNLEEGEKSFAGCLAQDNQRSKDRFLSLRPSKDVCRFREIGGWNSSAVKLRTACGGDGLSVLANPSSPGAQRGRCNGTIQYVG